MKSVYPHVLFAGAIALLFMGLFPIIVSAANDVPIRIEIDREAPCAVQITLPPTAKFLNWDANSNLHSTWSGVCENASANGQGELIVSDTHYKVIYEGNFEDGILQGDGVVSLVMGVGQNAGREIYAGHFLDGVMNGFGQHKEPSGRLSQGIFVNWLLHGEGVKTYQPGWQSEGKYEFGELVSGTMSFPNGLRLEGDFDGGHLIGQGKIFLPDGASIKGNFKDGDIVGIGEKTYPDGMRYVGELKKGDEHGQGIIHFSEGGLYEGAFMDGLFEGQGKTTMPDGTIYIGLFKNGDLEIGEMFLPTGGSYVGEFKQYKRHGHGTYMFTTNDECEGEWKDDKLIGDGEGLYEGKAASCSQNEDGAIVFSN